MKIMPFLCIRYSKTMKILFLTAVCQIYVKLCHICRVVQYCTYTVSKTMSDLYKTMSDLCYTISVLKCITLHPGCEYHSAGG